jgi:enterochelin esterase-like enzyme
VRGLVAFVTAALVWLGAVPAALAQGHLVQIEPMAGEGLLPRQITVWLPPGYDDGQARYPVLYMHDGQNLFDDSSAGSKGEWGVDEAVARLAAEGRIRPAIVVGVWSTAERARDYAPAKPIADLPPPWRERLAQAYGDGAINSDAYVRFLVEQVKPLIDETFRTLPGREDTFIGGSSMGGLISLYALTEHPEVFGGAAAISTHWPLFADWPVTRRPEDEVAAVSAMWTRWLEKALPDSASHRIYFDHGTETLDVNYAPYQQAVDKVAMAQGYVSGCNLESRVFEGAAHDEPAWRARLDAPLIFLLGPRAKDCRR